MSDRIGTQSADVLAAVVVAAHVAGVRIGLDGLRASAGGLRDVRLLPDTPGRALPPAAYAARMVALRGHGTEDEARAAFLATREALAAAKKPASTRDVVDFADRVGKSLERHAGAVRSVSDSITEAAKTHRRVTLSANLIGTIAAHAGRPARTGRSGHEEAIVGAREVRSAGRVAQIRAALPGVEYRDAPGGASLLAPARGDAAGTKAPVLVMTIPLGSLSEDLGGFLEVVDGRAFDRTLREDRAGIVGLWQHDAGAVLGRLSNGTMTATVLADRLEAVVTLDSEDPSHVGFARRVARGDVTSASFGFECRKDRWEERPDGTVLRTLLDTTLHDISAVTFPAYPASSATARSAAHRLSPAVALARLRAKKLARITAAHGLAGVR